MLCILNAGTSTITEAIFFSCLLSPLTYLQLFNLCFKPYVPIFCTFLSEFIPIVTEGIILYFLYFFLLLCLLTTPGLFFLWYLFSIQDFL